MMKSLLKVQMCKHRSAFSVSDIVLNTVLYLLEKSLWTLIFMYFMFCIDLSKHVNDNFSSIRIRNLRISYRILLDQYEATAVGCIFFCSYLIVLTSS